MFEQIPTGENVIVLRSSYDNTSACVQAVDGLYRLVLSLNRKGILSVRRSLDCVALEYLRTMDLEGFLRECEEREWGRQQTESGESDEVLQVLVCYDPEFAKDIESVSRQSGLSMDQIVELHSSITYDVWMIGFMPGFPYMGRLPDELHLERKATPELRIPAGSVAIANEFVGIYPFESPGGWNVIGRTSLRIVDYSRPRPFTFDYGKRVKFIPMARDEFIRQARA